jgi:hypothetical protein
MGFDASFAAAFQAITMGILRYGRFIDNDWERHFHGVLSYHCHRFQMACAFSIELGGTLICIIALETLASDQIYTIRFLYLCPLYAPAKNCLLAYDVVSVS